MELELASVASVTVICYLAGIGMKASALESKWIPLVCGVLGAVLGVVGYFTIPDFPASEPLGAVAVGIVSGLAATGVHQIGKQLGKEA